MNLYFYRNVIYNTPKILFGSYETQTLTTIDVQSISLRYKYKIKCLEKTLKVMAVLYGAKRKPSFDLFVPIRFSLH